MASSGRLWSLEVDGVEFRLRPACRSDLDVMEDLARTAYWMHRGLTDDLEYYFTKWRSRWDRAIDGIAPHVRLGILEHDSDPIGYAEWCDVGDALLIENVAVHPRNRHGGTAAGALVMIIAHEAVADGRDLLRLYTNSKMRANVRLYEQFGFRTIDVRDGDGYELVEMEMSVNDLPIARYPAVLRSR